VLCYVVCCVELCAAALDDDRGVVGQRPAGLGGWSLIKTAVIVSSMSCVPSVGVHMMGVPTLQKRRGSWTIIPGRQRVD
jgi:hypothetical protein